MSKFHYDILSEIGSGTFGTVNKVEDRRSGEILAMKRISKTKIQRNRLGEQVKKEIHAMKSLTHPNIVQIKEVLMDPNHLFIIMEFVEGGELYSKLATNGKMSENVAKKYFKQIMEAVKYCHCKNICHRDIKCENILTDSHDNIKIADFGFASMMEVEEGYIKPEFETIIEGKESDMKAVECGDFPLKKRPAFHRQPSKVMRKMSTICGTSLYMAPEIIKGDGYYGDKADIWSCGVVLYYLLTYSFPYDEDSNSKKQGNDIYEIPNSFSDDLVDLLSKILDRNPVTRYSARNILNHRWFNSERDVNVHSPIKETFTRKIVKQGRMDTGNPFKAASTDKLHSCILSNLPLRECVSISGRALTKNSWVHMQPDEKTVSLKASKMTPSGLAMIELDFKVVDSSKTILNLVIFGNKSGGLDDIISLMSYIKEVLS